MTIEPFTVQLTPAQWKLFATALREHDRLGDCALNEARESVKFFDTEGVHATTKAIVAVPTMTARTLNSYQSLRTKIDRGVVSAMERTGTRPL